MICEKSILFLNRLRMKSKFSLISKFILFNSNYIFHFPRPPHVHTSKPIRIPPTKIDSLIWSQKSQRSALLSPASSPISESSFQKSRNALKRQPANSIRKLVPPRGKGARCARLNKTNHVPPRLLPGSLQTSFGLLTCESSQRAL